MPVSGHLVCACTHMTSFGSFLKKGEDTLTSSNIDIWDSLINITFNDLLQNIAFHIALVFWGSYLLFTCILEAIDRYKLRGRFTKIYSESKKPKTQKVNPITDSSTSNLDVIIQQPSERKKSSNSLIFPWRSRFPQTLNI